jgi:uncharacterized membrane protein YidH (DUF202 family)
MAVGLPIFAYGCLILGGLFINWNRINATGFGPGNVALVGSLIVIFGAGLSLAGLGRWANRKHWSRSGWLAAILAFVTYVAMVLTLI